jgi:hypothetical protein
VEIEAEHFAGACSLLAVARIWQLDAGICNTPHVFNHIPFDFHPYFQSEYFYANVFSFHSLISAILTPGTHGHGE